jgi:hypothetical protein
MPGSVVLLMAGPLAGWIMEASKNEALFSGLSSLGAGLCSIGIPRSMIPFYEAELKIGRFLLIVHGSAKEVEVALGTIKETEKEEDIGAVASILRGGANITSHS